MRNAKSKHKAFCCGKHFNTFLLFFFLKLNGAARLCISRLVGGLRDNDQRSVQGRFPCVLPRLQPCPAPFLQDPQSSLPYTLTIFFFSLNRLSFSTVLLPGVQEVHAPVEAAPARSRS